jgi:hypothetical protein
LLGRLKAPTLHSTQSFYGAKLFRNFFIVPEKRRVQAERYAQVLGQEYFSF